MLKVDGTTYNFPCDIDRQVTLQESDVSGMLMNKRIYHDVIGSYLSYDVTVVIPIGSEEMYAQLYDLLASPVTSHIFTFPYNQREITFEGSISQISDKLYRKVHGTQIWRNISFRVTANQPMNEGEENESQS